MPLKLILLKYLVLKRKYYNVSYMVLDDVHNEIYFCTLLKIRLLQYCKPNWMFFIYLNPNLNILLVMSIYYLPMFNLNITKYSLR